MPISAPLKLAALTLRGIGSYFNGARLEVRPIIVLCGTNGSGKPTWLKAINVLKRSKNATLKFYMDATDGIIGSDQVDKCSGY